MVSYHDPEALLKVASLREAGFMVEWRNIEQVIAGYTGVSFSVQNVTRVSGGSINSCCILSGDCGKKYFVKINKPALHAMFVAEAKGLAQIANTQTIAVPAPIGDGKDASKSFLILEHLELAGASRGSIIEFAEHLAQMHSCTAERFGWCQDNTIGATPQTNTWESEWASFWQQHRLGVQLALAESNGYARQLQPQGDKLLADMSQFFKDYFPQAALLHGDLWSGNYGFTATGIPVIFDPAVYYGDRETDIAMTELFGGFGSDFYASYNAVLPLSSGYRVRKNLYNLYHILNHLNLFGAAYLSQAEGMLDQLLAEIA